MACRMPEGSPVIEILISHEGCNYFVCGRQVQDRMRMAVTCMSVIDLLVGMYFQDIDQVQEYDKVKDVIYEAYDFEENEFPDDTLEPHFCEAMESDFYEAFKIVRHLLKTVTAQPEEESERIRTSMKEYMGKNLSELLPV